MTGGLFLWCQCAGSVGRNWQTIWEAVTVSNLGERSGLQSWVMAIGKEKNVGEKVFHEVDFWCKIDIERAVKGVLLFTFLMFEITALFHMFEII